MKTLGKTICMLLAALLLGGLVPCASAEGGQEDFAADGLGGTLERYIAERHLNTNSITLGWRDLSSGEEYYYGADVFREGASTYKLPLCMLYADRVAAGEITREDKLGAYTVDLAVRDALVISSNNAADALRNHLSQNQVEYRRAIAANCGLPLDELPGGYYTANQFSPRYLIGTLQTLWDGREGKYDWIVEYMIEAQPDSYFSRWRGEYTVAHKTGNALGYICDTGIIYTERPFLLTVMTFGLNDAERVIADIARIAMDYAEYLAAQSAPTPEPTPAPTPQPTPEPTPAPTPKPAPEPTPEPMPAPQDAAWKSAAWLPAAIAGGTALLALPFVLRRRKKNE